MNATILPLSQVRVAIVGLGLMGGSLAMALKGKCAALYGIDPDRTALELARRQKIVDYADSDPDRILPEADLVVLAAPVPVILTLLDQLPDLTPNPCAVLDLGSTKQLIVEAMHRLPKRFDPIGGHPLCGKEKLSLTNAEQTLFSGAPFLLTPLERTTPRALSVVRQMIETVGARAVVLEPAGHDRILAVTSHLPFLLASALTLAMPTEAAALIGPGLKSASRLAGTSSSMMLGVLQSNRENVLNALHEFQGIVAEIEALISSDDRYRLEAMLNEAQSKYRALIQ